MLMIENVEAAGALCPHNGTRAISEATMGKDSYWATLCIYISPVLLIVSAFHLHSWSADQSVRERALWRQVPQIHAHCISNKSSIQVELSRAV
jgi:hypothetical protein